ncbi:MAG: sensor histidine kinase [Patescibacteria group bacterium]
MISLTAYSILRHNLFNIKIIATELFIFSLWIVILIRTIISENLTDFTVNGILLISTIILGIFLIRSVIKEVSQREHIENLARNLSRTNTKLEIANERLKELDRQKTEFVSMASHQLRTPLTAIRGYTSMLLEGSFGKLTKKQQEAAQVVMDSGQRLSNIIEDFLTLTRMELGKMKYEITEFDLKQTVEDLIKEMKPGIEQKGLKIKSSAGRGQFNFKGDYGKISQVLSNLIDNASKYTQEGEISIRLDKENDKFKITVADTGVGMDQKTINNLFQKFVRADGAGKINYVGTGLGLFVARQIVESHQGKIWAESDGPKQGSRFIVELPDVAEMENTKNLEDFAENL